MLSKANTKSEAPWVSKRWFYKGFLWYICYLFDSFFPFVFAVTQYRLNLGDGFPADLPWVQNIYPIHKGLHSFTSCLKYLCTLLGTKSGNFQMFLWIKYPKTYFDEMIFPLCICLTSCMKSSILCKNVLSVDGIEDRKQIDLLNLQAACKDFLS